MAKKLYVGNLSYSVQDQDLQDLFSQAGAVVSARVITDRDSGRSKGFGFVEMENDGDADSSIEKFNGQDFQGRALRVSEAKPQESRGGGGGGPRRDGGGFGGGGGRGGPRRSGGGGGFSRRED